MNFDLVFKHWDLFLGGIWVTLHLTALALIFGMLIALPASLSLARKTRFSPLVGAYVYVFRGTPLLVQTYLIYYGLAQFELVKDSFAWPILRGAIATTPKGELEGARSVGLSERQVTWLVLLPSAMRRALPQYGNEVVFMLHGSVVASIITIQDILGVGRTVNAKYYIAYEGILSAAVLYMAITFLLVRLFREVENRYLKHLKIDVGEARKLPGAVEGIPVMH